MTAEFYLIFLLANGNTLAFQTFDGTGEVCETKRGTIRFAPASAPANVNGTIVSMGNVLAVFCSQDPAPMVNGVEPTAP